MISKIQLQIVPDESLPESLLSAFVERAKALGMTGEELMVQLIRKETAIASEPLPTTTDIIRGAVAANHLQPEGQN